MFDNGIRIIKKWKFFQICQKISKMHLKIQLTIVDFFLETKQQKFKKTVKNQI